METEQTYLTLAQSLAVLPEQGLWRSKSDLVESEKIEVGIHWFSGIEYSRVLGIFFEGSSEKNLKYFI